MKLVALAGGVGGARMAHGFAQVLPPKDLTVVVNTGDDFDYLGLPISPDIDTVMYTLAGLANPETGWGLAGETWGFLKAVERLGGPTWFRIGDMDLATHVMRRQGLIAGQTLTQVTQASAEALGVAVRILPMTDDRLRTMVQTDEGELEFQDYFVRRRCQPRVSGFRFDGADSARPTPDVMAAIREADLVVVCPSNPFVSIGPILQLPGVRAAIASRAAVAVSPIVGGQALKGPAGKMLAELGLPVSPLTVAEGYADMLTGFVLDERDASFEHSIAGLGLRVLVTDTIMRGERDRERLAREVLAFARQAVQA
jgi:LPPG:FO 2-phospho-L-lactate transferase